MRRSNTDNRAAALLLLLAMTAMLGAFCANMIVHRLFPMRYSELIGRSCEEFGVDESLIYAIIHTESGFDAEARSSVGALGLMQIMPETFEWLQTCLPPEREMTEAELLVPEVNIRYGVYYVSRLERLFGSDTLVAAAYHAGQGSVLRWLDESGIEAGAFSREDIPSAATCHYVSKVERARSIYRRLYFR